MAILLRHKKEIHSQFLSLCETVYQVVYLDRKDKGPLNTLSQIMLSGSNLISFSNAFFTQTCPGGPHEILNHLLATCWKRAGT